MERQRQENVFRDCAAEFKDFLKHLRPQDMADLHRLVDELGVRLRRFSQRCEAQGASAVQVRPARLALAVLADQTMRTKPDIDLRAWSGLARQTLFEGRDISKQDVTGFSKIAKDQGPEFADLADFLDESLQPLADAQAFGRKPRTVGGSAALIATVALLVFGLAGYLAYLETRFHQQVFTAYEAYEREITARSIGQSAQVIDALENLSNDLVHVRNTVENAPLQGMIKLPFADAAAQVQASYQRAVSRMALPLLADAVELALATEGQGLLLYDSLRAHGILTGLTAWEPDFLAGWVAAREETLGLHGFAAHVALISGPMAEVPPPDPLVMAQAREFAAETAEADRAWLEMLRGPRIAGLAPWDAVDAVPRLDQVALRRSGEPLQVPGLYTQHGWAVARDIAAGVSVQKARDLAKPLFGRDLPQQNDTPDLVMARQQRETIAFWQDWLADLRVIPFDRPETGIIVSGTLAQSRSPLPALLKQVWLQVGGQDRSRPRPLQQDVARAFGPMIQYVEQGRMDEIAALFASVNVALSTRDLDQARGNDAIMTVATRAQSIQSLRAAPRVVALLVEDTLAQISGGNAGENPLARAWAQVYPQCRQLLEGRSPFAQGPPATATAVEQILGPVGAIPLFFRQFGAPNLDMETRPWRWKTEARFAGLSPESAGFLEQAMTVHAGLFGTGSLGARFSVAALAERGQATLSIGGIETPVLANAPPVAIAWPGPAADQGIAVRFSGAAASPALTRSGLWGFLQLLADLRLRPRDDGQRFLIDMRDDNGRLFVELGFADPINPVSVRPLLQSLQCPEQL